MSISLQCIKTFTAHFTALALLKVHLIEFINQMWVWGPKTWNHMNRVKVTLSWFTVVYQNQKNCWFWDDQVSTDFSCNLHLTAFFQMCSWSYAYHNVKEMSAVLKVTNSEKPFKPTSHLLRSLHSGIRNEKSWTVRQ